MSGFVVLLLAVAIPLGIITFAIKATEAERANDEQAPVSKLCSALCFGAAALFGVVWVLRGTGAEYASAMGLITGIPAAVIAALLAAAGHHFLVARSKWVAAFAGLGITLFTAFGVSSLFAVLFAPDHSTRLFLAASGAVIVLTPSGIPVLFMGVLVGLLLSDLSNRKTIKS